MSGHARQSYEKAGRRAETFACWYLRAKGYKILARRYKTKVGEIDIIARKKTAIIIVEVKQRQNLAACENSLHPGVWKRLDNAARVFMSKSPSIQNLAQRYDAVFIIGRWRVVHRQDMWRPK